MPATVLLSGSTRTAWSMLAGDAVKVLLGAPQLAKTAHFALHVAPPDEVAPELSTAIAPFRTGSVDNNPLTSSHALAVALVVPKRHARRAVTRNLVKRQMREALRRHGASWHGRVLIRQRGAFAVQHWISAASTTLREDVRRELDALFERAAAQR